MAWGDRTVGLVREDIRLMQKAVDDAATRPKSPVDRLAVSTGLKSIERKNAELAELTKALPTQSEMSILFPMMCDGLPRMIGISVAKAMVEAGWVKPTDQSDIYVIEEKGCVIASERFVRDTPASYATKAAAPAP